MFVVSCSDDEAQPNKIYMLFFTSRSSVNPKNPLFFCFRCLSLLLPHSRHPGDMKSPNCKLCNYSLIVHINNWAVADTGGGTEHGGPGGGAYNGGNILTIYNYLILCIGFYKNFAIYY